MSMWSQCLLSHVRKLYDAWIRKEKQDTVCKRLTSHHSTVKNTCVKSVPKVKSVTCSPLIGSNGGMWGYPRDRLPQTPFPLCLTPASSFSISWHWTGPFGAVVALGVILTATAADSALRLADALAAAEPVDHILGDGIVESLPVLLGNEDSGKHSRMWGN